MERSSHIRIQHQKSTFETSDFIPRGVIFLISSVESRKNMLTDLLIDGMIEKEVYNVDCKAAISEYIWNGYKGTV